LAGQVQLAPHLDLAAGGLVRHRDEQELSVLCLAAGHRPAFGGSPDCPVIAQEDETDR
jgi:hypothetical protein